MAVVKYFLVLVSDAIPFSPFLDNQSGCKVIRLNGVKSKGRGAEKKRWKKSMKHIWFILKLF